jgi:hypothetical protein
MSQQINLFNPLFRRKRFSPTSANAMLYGVGIIVVLAALYGIYQENRTRDIARRAQEVNLKFSEATALREKLAAQLAQQKPNAELAAEINHLEARLKGRQDIVEALNSGAVGTTGGYSEYMRAFSRQTVNGLWLTGFDIASAGNEFMIEGRTLSADLLPSYLKRLNAEKTLQGRQFATLSIGQPKPEPVSPGAPAAQASNEIKSAADAKSGAAAKDTKSGKDAAPNAPRYLEFTISTSEAADAAQKARMSAAPAAPATSLQAQTGPSTTAVLDSAMRASGGKPEPAK